MQQKDGQAELKRYIRDTCTVAYQYAKTGRPVTAVVKNVTEVVLHLHLFLYRVQPYNRGNFVFSCRQECLTATSTRLATGQFEPKLLKNYKEHMLYL